MDATAAPSLSSNDRLLAGLSHLMTPITGPLMPIVALASGTTRTSFGRAHVLNSLNAQLTLGALVVAAVMSPLSMFLMLIPVKAVAILAGIFSPIVIVPAAFVYGTVVMVGELIAGIRALNGDARVNVFAVRIFR